jgi:hypothetical protein
VTRDKYYISTRQVPTVTRDSRINRNCTVPFSFEFCLSQLGLHNVGKYGDKQCHGVSPSQLLSESSNASNIFRIALLGYVEDQWRWRR